MQNNYNLPEEQFKKIQSLSGDQLKAAGKKLGSPQGDDEKAREAVARHIAQGGDMEQLFQTETGGAKR